MVGVVQWQSTGLWFRALWVRLPSPTPLKTTMSTKDKYFLGLDIGASSVKYGYGNCQQGLQHFSKISLSHKSLSCLQDSIQQILSETDAAIGIDNILAIGIGTPGTIDRTQNKIVGVNPNLPYWVDHDPRKLIPPELSMPVVSDNDANLMCLAEAMLRRHGGHVVGITVGSGIGCGYVLNSEVYHGSHGFAMELGHVTAITDGDLCNCGRKGCLEAYASVDGIRRRVERELALDFSSSGSFSLIELISAQQEYPRITELIQEGMHALALGISNLVVVMDPDLVVIGGGAMDAGLYELTDLEKIIRGYLPPLNSSHLTLDKALEGNRAGVWGAIFLAEQYIGSSSE